MVAVNRIPPKIGGQHRDNDQQDFPRPHKCPLCDKTFQRLEHQTRHTRTHTGEKPHACQYPGCTKRYSRSEELARHSRTHNDPKSSRRGVQEGRVATMNISRSPIVSHPCSYAPYPTTVPSNDSNASWNVFPSLSAYAMSPSHSYGEGHLDSHRNAKRLRFDSPNPTSPSSPTFSQDSPSPTPNQTALATPMHSPSPRPYSYDLPAIRDPSLQQTSTLKIMEPQHVDGQYHTNNQTTTAPQSTPVTRDLMSRTYSGKGKLPAPLAPVVIGQQTVDDFIARSNHPPGR